MTWAEILIIFPSNSSRPLVDECFKEDNEAKTSGTVKYGIFNSEVMFLDLQERERRRYPKEN